VKGFIQLKLAHEIRLSVLPILLGGGLPFFDHIQKSSHYTGRTNRLQKRDGGTIGINKKRVTTQILQLVHFKRLLHESKSASQ